MDTTLLDDSDVRDSNRHASDFACARVDTNTPVGVAAHEGTQLRGDAAAEYDHRAIVAARRKLGIEGEDALAELAEGTPELDALCDVGAPVRHHVFLGYRAQRAHRGEDPLAEMGPRPSAKRC